ncbi:MAG: sensor histidine kinase [Acidobacteriaceae bacterium]
MNQPDALTVEEAGRIHALTLQMAGLDVHREPGLQLVSLLVEIFRFESAAIFDADLDKVYALGEWGPEMEDALRSTYFFSSSSYEPEIGLVRRALRMGELAIGSVMLRGEVSPAACEWIASLIAMTFDRYHSLANVSRTESAQRAEQLRTTVLDSLAHAYKTPLTAIRAATSGLQAMGGLSAGQDELVQLIDEQIQWLSELTTRLLKTARIESRDVALHKEAVAVRRLVDGVVEQLADRLAGFDVDVLLEREGMMVCCDRELMESLLTQYVDNAGKFADPNSKITIEVTERPQQVVFAVHNFGLGIAPEDQERVFDRYFRCEGTAQKIPGTGVGLSVAMQVARAHGGDVWLASDPEGGTRFFASLPKESTLQEGA